MGELDRALYTWFQAWRLEGKAVSESALIGKAKKLKGDLGVEEECNLSMGWLRNFNERHGIHRRKVQGERNSTEHKATENFSQEFLCPIRAPHKVSPEQVYETPLFWRCLPTSTLSAYNEKEAVGFKLNKDRIMMLTCANAAVTHKCKLFVVGRFKKLRAFKNLVHSPVYYDASDKAWMTATGMLI